MIELPFKDRVKQLRYLRKYQKEKREKLKRDKAVSSALEQAVKLAREHLVGRRVYPIVLATEAEKSVTLPKGISIPIIHADFQLGDYESLREAVLRVVEQEDKLLLVGEHQGWSALGIYGLATVPIHNVVSCHTWYAGLLKAWKTLRDHGHFPPYDVILNSNVQNTILPVSKVSVDRLELDITIHRSPILCNSEGKQNNALVVKSDPRNTLVVAQDLTVFSTNGKAKLYEAITPRIEAPKAICEIIKG